MSDNDVCKHQNANYLRMMSERDALRDVVRELDAVMHHHAERADAAEAEVERLREGYQAACEARMTFHDELDEAQRQVADLRAGIEAAVATLNREVYRQPTPWIDRLANDLRTLLAGSGEQPGEVDGYCTCHDDQKGRTRDCGVKVHREAGRPAPVVPDSADVRGEAEAALIRATKGDDPTAWVGTGWWHVHRLLAVVGQGVTAEQALREAAAAIRGEWQHRVADEIAHDLELRATRLRAAVRPSGQEGS